MRRFEKPIMWVRSPRAALDYALAFSYLGIGQRRCLRTALNLEAGAPAILVGEKLAKAWHKPVTVQHGCSPIYGIGSQC